MEISHLQNKIISYEQLICANEDMNTKLDGYEQTIGILTTEKEKLEKELEAASTQIEKVENKCYDLRQKLDKSEQECQMKEEQIKLLKSVIQDLRMKLHIYVPAKVFYNKELQKSRGILLM